MHPVLESLVGTEHEWIKAILFAFNAGDIPTFEKLTPSMASEVCHCYTLFFFTLVFP